MAELYPFESLADDLGAYLQSQLGATIEYAEKYGINIPISEDLAVSEPLENGQLETDHDELSLLLQNATSSLIPNDVEDSANVDLGSSTNEGSTSLSDSLGLGKLIQESLSGQGDPAKEELADTTATNGTGSDIFDSGGLASLIASKLNTGFGNVSNGSPSFSSPQPYHPTTLPPTSAGKFAISLAIRASGPLLI